MDNNKWKEWFQSIRSGDRLPKKNHLLILFLVGMILFVAVFPFPASDHTGTDTAENVSATTIEERSTAVENMKLILKKRLRMY